MDSCNAVVRPVSQMPYDDYSLYNSESYGFGFGLDIEDMQLWLEFDNELYYHIVYCYECYTIDGRAFRSSQRIAYTQFPVCDDGAGNLGSYEIEININPASSGSY